MPAAGGGDREKDGESPAALSRDGRNQVPDGSLTLRAYRAQEDMVLEHDGGMTDQDRRNIRALLSDAPAKAGQVRLKRKHIFRDFSERMCFLAFFMRFQRLARLGSKPEGFLSYFRLSSTATATETVIPTMGEQCAALRVG